MGKGISDRRHPGYHKQKIADRKRRKKGAGVANLFACKVCWRSEPSKYVEFRLSGKASTQFAANKIRINCPECGTSLPQFRSEYNESRDRTIGKHGYWVPVYLPPQKNAALVAIAQGTMQMIKTGEVPQDERTYCSLHDESDMVVPEIIKEELDE